MRNLYYIVIFIVIILSGCNYNQDSTNNHTQNYDLNSEEKLVVNEPYDKKIQENTTDKENESGITYINEELGFGITFPAHWDGYYKVTDTEGGISINFYGKSLAGRGATNLTKDGLPMFFILNEEMVTVDSLDDVEKIGAAKSINYYFATGTSVDLEPIILIDDESINWHKELYGEEVYGESQLSIIYQDWNKAQQMIKDIPGIIESFTIIK